MINGIFNQRWRDVPIAVAMGIATYLSTVFGVEWAGLTNEIAVVWLSSGILLGALLSLRVDRWLPYLCAFYLSQICASLVLEEPIGVAILYPFGDFIGTLVGAILINRYTTAPFRLTSLREITALIGLGAGLAQVLGGFFGALVAFYAYESPFFSTWLTWTTSAAVGIVVVVPPMIVLPRMLAFRFLSHLRLAELFIVLLAAGLLTYYFEQLQGVSRLYLISPVLLYAALRFQVAGAAIINLLAMAIVITVGLDRLVGLASDEKFGALASILFSQFSLLVLFLPGLFSATLIEQLYKSRASLAAAQEKYRDFAEAAADWQWEANADREYTGFSKRFEEASGYDIADLLGKRRVDISVDPESESFKSHEKDLQEHRPFRAYRYWYKSPMGAPRLGEISGKPVFDVAGNFTGYRGTGSDITDRFEAEERFRAIFERASIAMLIVRPDGTIQDANKKLCQLLGYEKQELEAMKVSDITHPDDLQKTDTNFARMVSDGSDQLDVEKRYLTKSGELIWGQLSVAAVPGPTSSSPLHFVSAIYDVTLQKALSVQISGSEAQYRQAARLARTGHWIWDNVLDECEYCSPEMAELFGGSVEEFLGTAKSSAGFLNWLHPEDKDVFARALAKMNENPTGFNLVARVVLGDKMIRHFHFLTEGVHDESGHLVQTHGVLMDITEHKKNEEKLSYQASHDALTGLINRSEFEQRANRLLSTIQTDKTEHAMCFLDLDQFKIINDTCGHFAGDELLRQLGILLRNTVRKRDTLARLGGDEFGILMEHCGLDHAHRAADTILDAIKGYQFSWEGETFRIGVSIGLIAITEDSDNYTDLFKQADAACYLAKELGRNRIHVYHPDDAELAGRHGEMQWVGRIHHALDENRFCLYAQPIVSLDSDDLKHYELLVRMLGEQDEIIPPGAFLPAAERYNLIERIDTWVVERAISLMASHSVFVEQVNFISINLSGQSVANAQFMPMVIALIAESNIDASKVCFEVTETAAISNLLAANTFIAALKDLGCRFALDDFGSGLSSFGYLKNLPVDYLKIDGMFVKDIVDDPIDKAMVKSINDIGHVMGMKTIAEFVENDAIMEQLNEIGVDYVQGYGIGKPEPFNEVISQFDNV